MPHPPRKDAALEFLEQKLSGKEPLLPAASFVLQSAMSFADPRFAPDAVRKGDAQFLPARDALRISQEKDASATAFDPRRTSSSTLNVVKEQRSRARGGSAEPVPRSAASGGEDRGSIGGPARGGDCASIKSLVGAADTTASRDLPITGSAQTSQASNLCGSLGGRLTKPLGLQGALAAMMASTNSQSNGQFQVEPPVQPIQCVVETPKYQYEHDPWKWLQQQPQPQTLHQAQPQPQATWRPHGQLHQEPQIEMQSHSRPRQAQPQPSAQHYSQAHPMQQLRDEWQQGHQPQVSTPQQDKPPHHMYHQVQHTKKQQFQQQEGQQMPTLHSCLLSEQVALRSPSFPSSPPRVKPCLQLSRSSSKSQAMLLIPPSPLPPTVAGASVSTSAMRSATPLPLAVSAEQGSLQKPPPSHAIALAPQNSHTLPKPRLKERPPKAAPVQLCRRSQSTPCLSLHCATPPRSVKAVALTPPAVGLGCMALSLLHSDLSEASALSPTHCSPSLQVSVASPTLLERRKSVSLMPRRQSLHIRIVEDGHCTQNLQPSALASAPLGSVVCLGQQKLRSTHFVDFDGVERTGLSNDISRPDTSQSSGCCAPAGIFAVGLVSPESPVSGLSSLDLRSDWKVDGDARSIARSSTATLDLRRFHPHFTHFSEAPADLVMKPSRQFDWPRSSSPARAEEDDLSNTTLEGGSSDADLSLSRAEIAETEKSALNAEARPLDDSSRLASSQHGDSEEEERPRRFGAWLETLRSGSTQHELAPTLERRVAKPATAEQEDLYTRGDMVAEEGKAEERSFQSYSTPPSSSSPKPPHRRLQHNWRLQPSQRMPVVCSQRKQQRSQLLHFPPPQREPSRPRKDSSPSRPPLGGGGDPSESLPAFLSEAPDCAVNVACDAESSRSFVLDAIAAMSLPSVGAEEIAWTAIQAGREKIGLASKESDDPAEQEDLPPQPRPRPRPRAVCLQPAPQVSSQIFTPMSRTRTMVSPTRSSPLEVALTNVDDEISRQRVDSKSSVEWWQSLSRSRESRSASDD